MAGDRFKTEGEHVQAVAKLLAERDWYAVAAGALDSADEPCLTDFGNFADCMGRRVSNEECDQFTKTWNARLEELRNLDARIKELHERGVLPA